VFFVDRFDLRRAIYLTRGVIITCGFLVAGGGEEFNVPVTFTSKDFTWMLVGIGS
jgi:hypothetical protein